MCAPAARWMSEQVTLAFCCRPSREAHATCIYFCSVTTATVLVCNDMVVTYCDIHEDPASCCLAHKKVPPLGVLQLFTRASSVPISGRFSNPLSQQHKWRCPAWVMPRSHLLHHNRSIDDFLPFFLKQPALPWAYRNIHQSFGTPLVGVSVGDKLTSKFGVFLQPKWPGLPVFNVFLGVAVANLAPTFEKIGGSSPPTPSQITEVLNFSAIRIDDRKNCNPKSWAPWCCEVYKGNNQMNFNLLVFVTASSCNTGTFSGVLGCWISAYSTEISMFEPRYQKSSASQHIPMLCDPAVKPTQGLSCQVVWGPTGGFRTVRCSKACKASKGQTSTSWPASMDTPANTPLPPSGEAPKSKGSLAPKEVASDSFWEMEQMEWYWSLHDARRNTMS